MELYVYTLASILTVSAVSLVGVFTLSMNASILSRAMHLLVGLAAGALLGDAFIHLIPEVFENGIDPTAFSIAVLAGMVVFFVLEKYLRWHHHHHDEVHDACADCEPKKKPLGTLVLVGDGMHNFIDGAVIAASFLVSPALGVATTLAVFLHEIPQEISDFALLLHGGFSRARALFWNFVSALTALLGAGVFFATSSLFENIEPLAIAFTAGGFIYIAAADLIPELHETKHPGRSLMQLIALLVGIGLMFALVLFE